MDELFRDLLLRLDPSTLLERAGVKPYAWQQRFLRSQVQRALVLASRQVGKSTASSALALHTAMYNPESTTLIVAPSQRQSQELAHKVRALARALEVPVVGDSALRVELTNGARVLALPGSPDTVRGFSPRLVIIDEAAYVTDELYAAVRPMLAVTQGRLVAISTPAGRRGWYYAAWTGEGDWERIRVTAPEIPSISPEFLEEERRALGELLFAQEYLAEFIGAGGAIPEDDVLRAIALDGPEPPQSGRYYVAGVDLARVLDWTAVVVIDATETPYRLVWLERWQDTWSATEERTLALLRRYEARAFIDATGVGDPVVERIRTQWPLTHPFRFTAQSKTDIVTNLRLTLAEGRLKLYHDHVLIGELLSLEARPTANGVSYSAPSGGHDDTVMAMALALHGVRGSVTSGRPMRVRSKWI